MQRAGSDFTSTLLWASPRKFFLRQAHGAQTFLLPTDRCEEKHHHVEMMIDSEHSVPGLIRLRLPHQPRISTRQAGRQAAWYTRSYPRLSRNEFSPPQSARRNRMTGRHGAACQSVLSFLVAFFRNPSQPHYLVVHFTYYVGWLSRRWDHHGPRAPSCR